VNKVPVFSTVSRTYGFLLGDFGTIFLIAWLPMLAMAAVNYLFGREAAEIAMAGATTPEAAQGSAMNLLISIVGALAGIMVTIALLRVVIFGQRPGGAFYLWFGMAELRLLGVYVLLTIAVIAAALAFALVAGVVAVAGGGPLIGALVPVMALVLIWVMLRLSIIPAVIAAENTMGVERAWALTKGNALRLFVVFLLVYLPFTLLMVAAMGVVLGGGIPAFPDVVTLASGGNPDALPLAVQEWQKGFMKGLLDNWMAVQILSFLGAIIQTALFAGIAGNAYMALAGEAPAHEA
jgi:hypothetical protein